MALHALSPLDGRYLEATSGLRDYFSEYAYLRGRVQIELEYLGALSKTGVMPDRIDSERILFTAFTEQDALQVQEIERATRHDVKAIEYFLRGHLPTNIHPWIHFGLTSEDVNNLAQAIALRDSRDRVLLPILDTLIQALLEFAKNYRALPMLARTHGQPAVPTTLGKEIVIFAARLRKSRAEIAAHRFQGKLTGAVGNFSALQAAYPLVDWRGFSTKFVESLGLEPNLATTQILPYDNWIRYFHQLQLVNSILLDYAQDMWRYISDGYLKQAIVESEIGSSTMPQKVNPINFENAEGNLGLANTLLSYYAQKLPVSRLQRDLSDSTVRRSFGVALGHTLLAWRNILQGMSRLAADEPTLEAVLDSHWEVISEGAQTILRLAGQSDAYESLKTETRGKVLTEELYHAWVEALEVDDATRARLANLSPQTYLGLAVEIADAVIKESEKDLPARENSDPD